MIVSQLAKFTFASLKSLDHSTTFEMSVYISINLHLLVGLTCMYVYIIAIYLSVHLCVCPYSLMMRLAGDAAAVYEKPNYIICAC